MQKLPIKTRSARYGIRTLGESSIDFPKAELSFPFTLSEVERASKLYRPLQKGDGRFEITCICVALGLGNYVFGHLHGAWVTHNLLLCVTKVI
jgi:hypothetical protein